MQSHGKILGQISTYLTPVKISGGVAEMSGSKRSLISSLNVEVLVFLHFEATIRQTRLLSKIEDKFRTFLALCKNWGGVGEMSE